MEDFSANEMHSSGAQLEQAANIAAEMKERQDTLRAEDALNQLRLKQSDLAYGENGFASVKGGDAVSRDLPKEYGAQFSNATQAISQSLDNDYQRQLFARRAQIANTDFQGDIARHVVAQREKYAGDVLEGTVATESQLASRNPTMAPTAAVRIDNAIKSYAAQFGKPKEWTEEKQTLAKSQLFTKVIEQAIDNDPTRALQLYGVYADNLTPSDRVVVGHQVHSAALPVQAKSIADYVMNGRQGANLEKLTTTLDVGGQAALKAVTDELNAGPAPTTSRDTRAMIGPWLADAEKIANAVRPNDPVFRDAVLQQVRGHVSNIIAAEEGVQRQAQGVLLQAASGGQDGKQPKPTTLDQLFAVPGARRAYTLLDPQAALGVQGLLSHNAAEAERGAPLRSDSKVVSDLFSKIHLDDDDPRKITRPEQLTPFFAHGLNRGDYDWLKRELVEAQTPEGSSFKKEVQMARNTGRSMLVRSWLGQSKPDQAEEAAYRFNRALDQQIDAYRRAGKDPRLLLTPGTSDYALAPERVTRFMTSPLESMRLDADKVRNGQAAPLIAQQAPVVNASAGGAQPPMKNGEMDATALKVGSVYKFNQGAFTYLGGDAKNPSNWDVPNFDAIPAGARFAAPDGKVYVKRGGEVSAGATATASTAASPTTAPATPSLAVPKLIEPSAPDERPGMAKLSRQRAGMEEGHKAQEIAVADFNVRLAEETIANFKRTVRVATAVATAPMEVGRAIGRAVPTDLEKSVDNFRALVRAGSYRVDSTPIIAEALASGALTAQEEQVARAMLENIVKSRR
jgi:hypothetical protein